METSNFLVLTQYDCEYNFIVLESKFQIQHIFPKCYRLWCRNNGLNKPLHLVMIVKHCNCVTHTILTNMTTNQCVRYKLTTANITCITLWRSRGKTFDTKESSLGSNRSFDVKNFFFKRNINLNVKWNETWIELDAEWGVNWRSTGPSPPHTHTHLIFG